MGRKVTALDSPHVLSQEEECHSRSRGSKRSQTDSHVSCLSLGLEVQIEKDTDHMAEFQEFLKQQLREAEELADKQCGNKPEDRDLMPFLVKAISETVPLVKKDLSPGTQLKMLCALASSFTRVEKCSDDAEAEALLVKLDSMADDLLLTTEVFSIPVQILGEVEEVFNHQFWEFQKEDGFFLKLEEMLLSGRAAKAAVDTILRVRRQRVE